MASLTSSQEMELIGLSDNRSLRALQHGDDLDVCPVFECQRVGDPLHMGVEDAIDLPEDGRFLIVEKSLGEPAVPELTLEVGILALSKAVEGFEGAIKALFHSDGELMESFPHPGAGLLHHSRKASSQCVDIYRFPPVRYGRLPKVGSRNDGFEVLHIAESLSMENDAHPPVDDGLALLIGDEAGEDEYHLAGGECLMEGHDRCFVTAESGEYLVIHPFHDGVELPEVLDSGPGPLILSASADLLLDDALIGGE